MNKNRYLHPDIVMSTSAFDFSYIARGADAFLRTLPDYSPDSQFDHLPSPRTLEQPHQHTYHRRNYHFNEAEIDSQEEDSYEGQYQNHQSQQDDSQESDQFHKDQYEENQGLELTQEQQQFRMNIIRQLMKRQKQAKASKKITNTVGREIKEEQQSSEEWQTQSQEECAVYGNVVKE